MRRGGIITLYNTLENLGRSGSNQIEADSFKWYTKRDPYNMLIVILIASSLPPHRLLMQPQYLLSNSSLTPQRHYITMQIKGILDFPAIFFINKLSVEV